MELRTATPDLRRLHAALLSTAPDESAAFIAAEPAGSHLVARSFTVFGREDLDMSGGELTLREDVQARALAQAKRDGHALVEAHTHPGSGPNVALSVFDEQQLPLFAKYVQHKMPGRPFGALVLSEEGCCGRAWTSAGVEPLLLRPAGEQATAPGWVATAPTPTGIESGPRFDRQVRALGPQGQARLRSLLVGIVGLGGTGSHVVQQLAHLGVRRYVLVEDDVVDISNLPRLPGSTRWDARIRRGKAAVAGRTIRRQSRRAFISCPGSLRRRASLTALKGVDVIIGCVDNEGARLVLSEMAAAYLIPYLDLGVGIGHEGSATAIGGRASFFLPGGPCLGCADEIEFGEAAQDLEGEALRHIRRQRGYASDRAVEPALMPLNAAVASLGMMELLAFATGMRHVAPFVRYDGLSNRLIRQSVPVNPDCPVCRPAHGMGDRRAIDRYALD